MQLFVNEQFCLVGVLFKYTHIDQLVLFRGVKLHAVPIAKVALHLSKLGSIKIS